MKKVIFRQVQDKDINFYLSCRNLPINRSFSLKKGKINKIDHYSWWFMSKNRISHFGIINKKKIAILTEQIHHINNLKIVYSGFISCVEKIDLIDLLNMIKWQNKRVLRHGSVLNVISVTKNNVFGNLQSKYFKFNKINKNSTLGNKISKIIKFNKKLNIYFKKIK